MAKRWTATLAALATTCAALVVHPPGRPPSRARAATANADPFRPAAPPIAPILINALQDVLRLEEGDADGASAVLGRTLATRDADPDYEVTAEEADLLTRRLLGVSALRPELGRLLEAVVGAHGWIRQFGAEASFGVGAATDPYVRMCRAECMLAAYMLHVERAPAEDVDFVDEDRRDALRDAPARAREDCAAVKTESL